MSNLWQIGAGNSGRRYNDLFLKHDVMLVGPGQFGPFDQDDSKYAEAQEVKNLRKSDFDLIRRFYSQVKKGDRVIARAGHKAVALGIVADDQAEWDQRFDDVYGWDVSHRRRVRWQKFESELASLQKSTGLFSSQKQISTLTRCDRPEVEHLFEKIPDRDLKELPKFPSDVLDAIELGKLLYDRGMAFDVAESLGSTLVKINQLIQWYHSGQNECGRPTEHEVVPYLVLPLLQGLGWSQQLVGVEWQKIDAAIFRRMPSNNENCCLVIEAKGLWDGLQNAREQAIRYVKERGLVNCNKALVTNGVQYYLYIKEEKDWPSKPTYYFNISKLRKSHNLFSDNAKGKSAIDGLLELTPSYLVGP